MTEVEIKKIDISKLAVQECPYVEWYKFRQCTIKTCKNFSATTTTHCLAVDRVQPLGNKIISDAELHLFKFAKSGVSTRLVSIKRKKAVTRVKAILILHSFIEYIKQHKKPDERYWSNRLVERLELEYPLRVMRLGYMNWMLPYLTSSKVYAKFALKKGGECEAFKIHTLLGLTEMKFKALRKSIKTPTTVEQPQPVKEVQHEPPRPKLVPRADTDRRRESKHDNRAARKLEKQLGVGAQQQQAKR